MESGELKESELYCPKCGTVTLRRLPTGKNYYECTRCNIKVFIYIILEAELTVATAPDEESCAKGTCDY